MGRTSAWNATVPWVLDLCARLIQTVTQRPHQCHLRSHLLRCQQLRCLLHLQHRMTLARRHGLKTKCSHSTMRTMVFVLQTLFQSINATARVSSAGPEERTSSTASRTSSCPCSTSTTSQTVSVVKPPWRQQKSSSSASTEPTDKKSISMLPASLPATVCNVVKHLLPSSIDYGFTRHTLF